MLLYPNPTTNQVRIDFPQAFRLDIHDTQGRLLKSIKKVQPHQVIDMSSWQAGIYFFKIDGQIDRKVVICR